MSEQNQLASVEIDDFDRTAIAAIQERKTEPGIARRLAPFVAELEARYPAPGELSDQARAELAQFERDGVRLGERLTVELETMTDSPASGIWVDPPPFVLEPPPLKRFFMPSVGNPGASHTYRLSWTHVEGYAGAVGTGAHADPARGMFWASQYATGSSVLSAFAGVGVRLSPQLDWCHLSVRPLVQWEGSDILQHRDAMPELNERRRARASGAIGVTVESWARSGGSHHVDVDHFVDVWDRIEVDPSGGRDYNGTLSSNTLGVTILASRQRRYAIWVYCWAYVESESGFAVATRASATIGCKMPLMVVEEIEI
jgi:hypothetical protein